MILNYNVYKINAEHNTKLSVSQTNTTYHYYMFECVQLNGFFWLI
jgi:hypothetical protein